MLYVSMVRKGGYKYMSKDKDKHNWFGGINFNPFHFKRNTYLPHYDTGADYNTNSKSYYDYLSRVNKILEMFKKFIIRLLNRDVKVEDTNTVKMKKEGDWIDNGKGCPPDNYDDEIILSAEVKRSKGKETLILNENEYEVGNALSEKQDGLFSPDYKELLEEFEASGGGTELDYSEDVETRTYTNIQDTPFNITNGSKNKGISEIHELWSPNYDDVLQAVDFRIGEVNDLIDEANGRIDEANAKVNEVINNPPEPDFGEILDTLVPKQNLFYTYTYNSIGGELSSSPTDVESVSYTLKGGENLINLSPGNQDIIISFTPILNNTEQYEIHEIQLRDSAGNPNNYRFGRGQSYLKNSSVLMNIKDLKNGVRRHIRLSDVSNKDSYNFGVYKVLAPVLRNKLTSSQLYAWEIDGTKEYPQTQEDINNYTFYMKDVEVRVINQADYEEEIGEE